MNNPFIKRALFLGIILTVTACAPAANPPTESPKPSSSSLLDPFPPCLLA